MSKKSRLLSTIATLLLAVSCRPLITATPTALPPSATLPALSTITATRQTMPVSNLGPPNPLPIFRWQQPTKFQPSRPSQDLTADEVEGAFLWGAASILPYQVQDAD